MMTTNDDPVYSYNKLYQKKKLRAWIDLSTFCNAGCPQCGRTNAKTNGKVSWLPLIQWSLAEFKKGFSPKTLQHITSFQLCGSFGDPMMNKDIFAICEYIINNSDAFIEINTNGSMRDEFWWTHLGYIIKDRGRIYFCVDGIDQEMHEMYRQKTNLELVLTNMEAYSTFGIASCFTIVFKHNEDHLKAIYKMTEDRIGEHYHLFVPSDRAYHLDKFEFNDHKGNKQFLEHSPKYTKKIRRDSFEVKDIL